MKNHNMISFAQIAIFTRWAPKNFPILCLGKARLCKTLKKIFPFYVYWPKISKICHKIQINMEIDEKILCSMTERLPLIAIE